jgi:hypothetical protein
VGAPAVSAQPEVAPSVEVATDMVRRGLVALPVLVLVAGLVRGVDGAVSAALGVALVLVNYTISARGIAWASRHGGAALMGTVFGGYIVRLGLVVVAFLLVRHQSWADQYAFGFTLLVTHVGLLVWETRYVGLTLAAPGLRPGPLAAPGKE